MKVYAFVILAMAAIVTATPVPQKNSEDVDVMIVPLEAQMYDFDDGDVNFPSGFLSFNPFFNPFSGFMSSMENMFRNLREQMSNGFGMNSGGNTEWKDIGDGKGNTTSTTKIINGHKVTINETVYSDGDENTGSFFKIRVVDVHPTSEEDSSDEQDTKKTKIPEVSVKDTEETTPAAIEEIERGSPEIQETSNEIPQGKPEEANSANDEIETLGEDFGTDALPDETLQSYKISNTELSSLQANDFAEPVEEIESNDVNSNFYDLSNDILVNQMMADSNAPHNPDAEIISPELMSLPSQIQPLYGDRKVYPIYSSYPSVPSRPILYKSEDASDINRSTFPTK